MSTTAHDAQGPGAHETIVDHTVHTHVCSFRTLTLNFAALLVLTVLTVVVSRFDFGDLNLLIAVAIAAVKASLVMTIFMHLKWDTAINNIAFLSSVLFLALLFLFTIADVATRGTEDPGYGTTDPSFQYAPQSFGRD
jgi:cytochrome c oxidase subunit 4